MEQPSGQSTPIKAQLGLWDAISIMVGIVIGAGIYETAPFILSNVSGPWMALGVWALCGVLTLIGALCYAELATTYPGSGGDYVYLTRAFGSWLGFLFGWAQLAVILTSSIGAMAYVFADYAVGLFAVDKQWSFLFAVLAVTVLSVFNMMGVAFGKRTQNVLTAAKILGLGGILVSGFVWGSADSFATDAASTGSDKVNFGLAMILVLYTYGGWNDTAFVAAEVRNRRRNIPLALVLGTMAIMVIYLLINAAYIVGLGFDGASKSGRVAADVLALPLGDFGANAMSLLVMISALGAVNGLIFTGSRVYSRLGADHRIFAWLGRWYPSLGVPVWSLVAQAVISLTMVLVVGSQRGQDAINYVLARVGDVLARVGLKELAAQVGLKEISWTGHGGFETLVTCTAPVFWLFFLLTGLSLFVLREKDRHLQRPFSVPFYPLVPLIFCNMCAYMLYSSISYVITAGLGGATLLLAALPLLVGLPLFWLSKRRISVVLPTGSSTEPDRLDRPDMI